jgi:hypothetical protein
MLVDIYYAYKLLGGESDMSDGWEVKQHRVGAGLTVKDYPAFSMGNETEGNISRESKRQYQIQRAKEYLNEHKASNSCEPSLVWCIIDDLTKIIEGERHE